MEIQHRHDPGDLGNRCSNGYQTAVAENYAPVAMKSDPSEECFTWSVRCRQVGPVKLSHVRCCARVHAAVYPGTNTADQQNLVLMSIEEGTVDLLQDRRVARCEPQVLTLMNVGRPLETRHSGAIDILSLTMPTPLLRAQFPGIEQRCGIALPAAMGTGSILRDLVKSILREREQIDATEARVLSGMLGNLIGCVARRQETVSPDQSRIDEYRRRIEAIIDRELQNTELSPAFIADRLGVSLSYLYRMARRAEISVGQSIIDSRLERCHEVLADPSWSARSITEIAFAWGFQELSHFSRRFSERYGAAPTIYRRRFLQS